MAPPVLPAIPLSVHDDPPLLRPRRAARSVRVPRLRGPQLEWRRIAAKLTGLVAMAGVAAFLVSTSVPAAAFYTQETAVAASSRLGALQTLEAEATAEVAPIVRDAYTVTSLAEQLRIKYGSRSYAYRNDSGGTIQWPFAVAVPITSGFGDRIAPCRGCSSFHEGVDFTPGIGTPIGAITVGTVSLVKSEAGGLGEHVIVDHVVNGQKVQSVYAHMLAGSIRVAVGETVRVADVLGLVGSTGASTGAHLHLEIHVNGVPVDPFAWLKANTN